MTKLRKVGLLTIAAIGTLFVFAGIDAAASLTKYKYGETVSSFIQVAQKAHPALRVAVVGALVYLIGHLELGWPL